MLRAVYILGLEAFGATLHLEFHFRAFFQRPVAGHLDRRKMDKHVLAAGSLDESVALGGVKPFHNTLFSHYLILLFPSRLAGTCHFKTLPLSHGSVPVCNQVLPSPFTMRFDLTSLAAPSRLGPWVYSVHPPSPWFIWGPWFVWLWSLPAAHKRTSRRRRLKPL